MRLAASVIWASVAAVPVLAMSLMGASVVASNGGTGAAPPAGDVPASWLTLYRRAAAELELGADGWSYLAAVGKIECDHGRSSAVGCRRGESNSSGAQGPAQFLPGTWAAYGVDTNGDGVRDVYDPADAIFGMANYLRASGAPANWPKALFAYNHADWYVERVLAQAAQYRSGTVQTGVLVEGGGDWLAQLPNAPGIRCDARIVADVVALARAYLMRVTACQGGAPHDRDGEHPLGLAIDGVPVDGDWDRMLRLARDFGWVPECARAGCPGRGPFRVILYNGYPDHGDPAHSRSPHLHLSWEHAPAAPFTRAAWVRTLLAPTEARR